MPSRIGIISNSVAAERICCSICNQFSRFAWSLSFTSFDSSFRIATRLNERVENALVNLRPPWYPLPGNARLLEWKEACDICVKKLFESSVVYMIVIKQRTKHIQRITYCSIFPTFHIRGWNDEHRKTSLLRSCWIRTTVTHRWYDGVSSYVFLLVQHSRLSQQTTFVLETLTVFSSISLIIINFLCSEFLLLSHFPKDNVDPDKSQNLNLACCQRYHLLQNWSSEKFTTCYVFSHPIFSNYFILDRGYQYFHPIKVPICGTSLLGYHHASLGWIFNFFFPEKNTPWGILKKNWR